MDGDVDLYQRALCLVLERGYCTASMIQCNLSLGYAKAIHLIDAMVARGVLNHHTREDGSRLILWDDKRRVDFIFRWKLQQIKSPHDPECIPLVLDALRLLWEEAPHLRFGQLICQIVQTEACYTELLVMEDARLIDLGASLFSGSCGE